MLRITSTAILGLALALPLSAFAASPVDQKAPEATIVAANEDAVVLPAATPAHTEQTETPARKYSARRGSNQSMGEFRFTNPYAFPLQALPVVMPNVSVFSGF
jgi:hypothetical protein